MNQTIAASDQRPATWPCHSCTSVNSPRVIICRTCGKRRQPLEEMSPPVTTLRVVQPLDQEAFRPAEETQRTSQFAHQILTSGSVKAEWLDFEGTTQKEAPVVSHLLDDDEPTMPSARPPAFSVSTAPLEVPRRVSLRDIRLPVGWRAFLFGLFLLAAFLLGRFAS